MRELGVARLRKLTVEYKGTSLIRNSPLLGPYSRPMPRVLGFEGQRSRVQVRKMQTSLEMLRFRLKHEDG